VFGALASLPSIPFAPAPTPVEELPRLREWIGGGPRLLVKRDDTIGFAFGGNKVRKIRLVAADALAHDADTLITCGGIQSNHARVTAAAAAKLGLRCILVANGTPPERPTANAMLDRLLGADIRYVGTSAERAAMMDTIANEQRGFGRHPYVIPLGASTPLGAAAFVYAFAEMLEQIPAPDAIIHASSSAGTQAGLIAGCALAGVRTRIIGISADNSSADLGAEIRRVLGGLRELMGGSGGDRFDEVAIEVDDGFVGEGYGVPTDASRFAIDVLARTEALFLDPTYTAKAMAGFITYARRGDFDDSQTVLFWHTGGQVGLFA
jgi:1-aminocyclopropane-1-carboxylate deaminase/D-cysteine desulfhydrase-like pyridoxal-dependent ACC family enzyme